MIAFVGDLQYYAVVVRRGAMTFLLNVFAYWYHCCCIADISRYFIAKLVERMDYQCIIVYTVITILPPRYDYDDRSSSGGCFGCIKRTIKR